MHPEEAHLGFVEPHAIGAASIEHSYERLEAFTLFLEGGLPLPAEAEGLPELCSEALAATMFELAFRELRGRAGVGGLLEIMPELTYVILAPFMGAEAGGGFVAEKRARGGAEAGQAS